MKLVKRLAQVLVIVCFGRIDPGEDHRLGNAVARQCLRGRPGRAGDGIADTRIMHRFQTGGNVTHLAGGQARHRLHGGSKDAHLDGFDIHTGRQHADGFFRRDLAFHHAHIGNDTLVRVVV